MTTQAVPFAGLDAGQLAVQQATLRVQAELAEELAAEPALRLPEEERASLQTRLEREVLEPGDILRIYAQAGKVLAETGRGIYQLRLRLYEAEQRLDSRSFARISNSEILNLKKVKGFDLSFTGTIRVLLCNGDSAYVSRRYVGKIKKILGI